METVSQGLADNDVRKEVWPFLLAVYPWTSTGEERARIAEAKRRVLLIGQPELSC